MFARFLSASGVAPADTIVDVRVSSSRAYAHSNYLEAWYPHKAQLTAVGIDDASFLEQLYPGVTFYRSDARALPFANDSFDFAHSSAVIEHAGSRADQAQLLAEMWRVCRKGIHAPRVESARLGGWTSNLLLIARKPAAAPLHRF